jgi:hypothetical protein
VAAAETALRVGERHGVHPGQPITPVLHANSAIGSQDYGGRFRIVGFSGTQLLPTQLIKPAAFRSVFASYIGCSISTAISTALSTLPASAEAWAALRHCGRAVKPIEDFPDKGLDRDLGHLLVDVQVVFTSESGALSLSARRPVEVCRHGEQNRAAQLPT